MYNILNQIGLLKPEVLQNRWLISAGIAGAVVIALLASILAMLKSRKSKETPAGFPQSGVPAGIDLAGGRKTSDEPAREDYDFVTERIKRVRKKYKSVLFASANPGSLPITIPVNVAIGLAKTGSRTLLIDVDIRRDALAEAFELAAGKAGLQPRAIQTGFENLWLWPAHNFAQLRQMNINQIVQKALDGFDFILINAPSLPSSADCRQIVSAAQAVFICAKSSSETAELTELIKPLNCPVIGNIQIPHT